MEETKEKKTKTKQQYSIKQKATQARLKAMKGANDFKKFAFKGNIIDLAIAVIIGTAFGKIISSLVADVIMPGLGAIIGQIDFSQLKIVLKSGDPEVAIRYGAFIQTILEFFIIALSIYLVFKVVMMFRHRAEKKRIMNAQPPATPALTRTEQLLTDIKELLSQEKE